MHRMIRALCGFIIGMALATIYSKALGGVDGMNGQQCVFYFMICVAPAYLAATANPRHGSGAS